MEGFRWSRPVSLVLYAVFFFLSSAAVSEANIAEYDEHWEQRRLQARAAAEATYHPDPIEVTNSFNRAVHRAMKEETSARRQMLGKGKHKKFGGPCLATNPIDRCWRCHANWAKHRKRLATCALGFGHRTTGGLAGEVYVVTDPSDDFLVVPRRGTLRYGVVQDRPLWIVFARDMVIRLTNELIVAGDKTIDGRGAQVHVPRSPSRPCATSSSTASTSTTPRHARAA
jgi:pectate lyase